MAQNGNRAPSARTEIIDGGGFEVDADTLAERLVDWGAVLRRFGGGLSMAAVRNEVAGDDGEGTGEFITTQVLIRHESYVPGRRATVKEPEPEPVEEPTDDELDMHFPGGVEVPEPVAAGGE